MAQKLANRAWMSTATTGTGTITLGSALSGYQSFADAGIGDGDTVRYTIVDGSNWEIGLGTYTVSGTTLTRGDIQESSNSGSAINLSGNATVFVTPAAQDVGALGIANTWTKPQGYPETALTWVGTGDTAWDVDAAPNAVLTASNGNTTIDEPSNVVAGRFYHIRITQATADRTVAWHENYHFIGGEAPTLTSGSGAVDHHIFYGRSSNILEEVGRAQGVATP